MYRTIPTPTVVLALAVAGGLVLSHVRDRRTATRAVRRALADSDPETRRAAVLVAARHGLARYARVLWKRLESENADCVLLALAEVTRAQRWRRGGGRRDDLRGWAEWFLAVRTVPRPEPPGPAEEGPGRRESDAGDALHNIDALEVIKALPERGSELPGDKATPAKSRRRWRARPNELDALKVVDGLAASRNGQRTPSTPAPNGRGHHRRTDIDALLNELAGVRPDRVHPGGARRVSSPTSERRSSQ
jgi:hypothetical protein